MLKTDFDLVRIIQLPTGFYRRVQGKTRDEDLPIHYIYYYDKNTEEGLTRISNCYNTEVIKYIDVTMDEAINDYGHVFI